MTSHLPQPAADAPGTGVVERGSAPAPSAARARVVLYSDDVETRAAVRRAVGRRASRDTPFIEWVEVATPETLLTEVAAGGNALLVLDGEAAKVGGFGLAREVKERFFDVPPVLLLVARPQDAWIAAWSQADGIVPFPLRPAAVADTVAALLRGVPSDVPTPTHP
ncbi:MULTISPECIES: hypothetical protein [Miniimonas]|uniref:hypothetical protein n=1 Tax=Miniimonas TaxID=947525 RepID=UPI001F442354|nr:MULTISPECIES: hypothetical protein [Miniimonas]